MRHHWAPLQPDNILFAGIVLYNSNRMNVLWLECACVCAYVGQTEPCTLLCASPNTVSEFGPKCYLRAALDLLTVRPGSAALLFHNLHAASSSCSPAAGTPPDRPCFSIRRSGQRVLLHHSLQLSDSL